MSAIVKDESVGMNGSFEVTKSGLPVNWLVYTPRTIPTGDYDLVIDTTEHESGRQSLKFVVRECSPVGGWHSPGISKEYPATPGVTYTVGVWVKNEGAEFVVRFGGVSAFKGEYETVVRTDESIGAWRHYQLDYTLPSKYDRLRLEMNVLRPGTFWIDDVTISGISSP